jgi:hypothetical protein
MCSVAELGVDDEPHADKVRAGPTQMVTSELAFVIRFMSISGFRWPEIDAATSHSSLCPCSSR